MSRPGGRRPVDQLLTGTIDRRLIAEHWDDLLRVGGSIKMGWVTASLLISRLQAAKRKSTLVRALREYGRLQKSEEYRRRINRQINKGESLNALRRRIFFADEGKVRRRHREEQVNQATCLDPGHQRRLPLEHRLPAGRDRAAARGGRGDRR